MYQRTLELLGNNRFGRCEIHLLSEREPRGDRKSEAERLYKKGPRTQKRVEDITANDLRGRIVIKRRMPDFTVLLTALISGTRNPFGIN
jgi:hypothetical protein